MFQKEVAERIVAPPGSKAYGRLAILAQWRSDAAHRLRDPAPGLHPAAEGDERRGADRAAGGAALPADAGDAVSASWRSPSASAARCCAPASAPLGPDVEALLAAAGIAPTERAEQVSLEAFCRLSRLVASPAPEAAPIPPAGTAARSGRPGVAALLPPPAAAAALCRRVRPRPRLRLGAGLHVAPLTGSANAGTARLARRRTGAGAGTRRGCGPPASRSGRPCRRRPRARSSSGPSPPDARSAPAGAAAVCR